MESESRNYRNHSSLDMFTLLDCTYTCTSYSIDYIYIIVFIQITELAFDTSSSPVRVAVFQVIFFSMQFYI